MRKLKRISILLFPGQGAQYVGMLSKHMDLARPLLLTAGQLCGLDLEKAVAVGPKSLLDRTDVSQLVLII